MALASENRFALLDVYRSTLTGGKGLAKIRVSKPEDVSEKATR